MKMYWEEISEHNWDNNNIDSNVPSSLLAIRQEKNELPIIYFDMDGVLAYWRDKKSPEYPDGVTMEDIFSKGYFSKLPPVVKFIEICKALHDLAYDVRIVSKAKYFAITEKADWLKECVPFIPKEHMYFVPIDANKSDFVPEIKHNDIIIDDYNPNLYEWKGSAVKALNGKNNVNPHFPSIGIDKGMLENLNVITWTLLREFVFDYKQGVVNDSLFKYIEEKSIMQQEDFLSMCEGFNLSKDEFEKLIICGMDISELLPDEKDDIEL